MGRPLEVAGTSTLPVDPETTIYKQEHASMSIPENGFRPRCSLG